MIPLSKIFKTNKLSYILRESEDVEDFNVIAPKDWNINDLKVGDTIVPNMWNKERIEQAISQNILESPNWFSQPHTIESFTRHEDVAFTDGTKRSLYFLKIFLQPQYQVNLDPLSESDKFNVDAPEDWNKIELTVGDTITPDMYTDEAVERWNYLSNQKMGSKTWGQSVGYFWTKPQTIYKVFPTYDGNYDLELESGLVLLSSDLKDQYSIVSNMFESEDEYNVDAPKEWNFKELGVGDSIVSGMFKNPRSSKRFWMPGVSEMIITEFDPQRQWLVRVMPKGGNIKTDLEPWNIYSVNQELKDQYKIVFPEDLTESQDEFNIDVPQGWNIKELGVGDILNNTNMEISDVNFSYKITDFKKNEYGSDLVGIIKYEVDDNGIKQPQSKKPSYWYVSMVNNKLKPGYQVVVPEPLKESDDDFTVDAPKEWGIEGLTVGDTLDPSNLKMQNFRKKYEILGFTQRPWGNDVRLKVYELVEEPIPGTRRTSKQWKEVKVYSADLNDLNDLLKDGYKIVTPESLRESDDDFTVDAPKNWNLNYEQPINITISYEEEVRDRTGKYGVLLKSYFTQTNLTELEQISGYNFPYDELTPYNVQRFIIDDQDLLIEIEDISNNPNIEVIESDNGFDFDNYQSIDINNFYVDVELPVS